MSQTAAHLVGHVNTHVPVRQWILSLPIPLRVLLAAQPELVTPVLQVVQRLVERHLLDHTGLKSDEGQGGVVTLIQRFGSAANLNIHLHCLVLDGVYRCDGDGAPSFVEAGAPTDEELHERLAAPDQVSRSSGPEREAQAVGGAAEAARASTGDNRSGSRRWV